MSDIQDSLIVLQRRMQQRQILAMMGINQWVQPTSETINIADITAPTTRTTTQSAASHTSVEQPSIDDLNADMPDTDISAIGLPDVEIFNTDILNNDSIDDTSSNLVDEDAINRYYHDANDDTSDITSTPSHEQSPVTYSFDTSTPNVATTNFVDTSIQKVSVLVEQTDSTEPRYDTLLKVAPFDLQGGRYGNWVVLVDIKALNNDSQKLWENITQALSIACETTSFPICKGMDTAELANASLAGYVFKIGRSEDIQIAALTELPEGLEHPNLADAPTLNEMLADSNLKRQLWAQISG